jgi:hypothetical protein
VDSAFYNCRALTNVTIPNSVTEIGEYAFCGCHALTNVTIPDSVQSIEHDAFHNCENLEKVYISKNSMLDLSQVFDESVEVIRCNPQEINRMLQSNTNGQMTPKLR